MIENIENICLNCRFNTDGSDSCPQCGHALNFNNDIGELQPRTVLNKKYIVGRRLGNRGGFGITYQGIEPELDRMIAIKEFLPKNIADRDTDRSTVTPNPTDKECIKNFENGLKLFLEEAKTLAKLNHPNIISIFSYFRENNTAYFVMPYLQGRTLEEFIKELSGGLTQEIFLEIFNPIFDGLEAIHKKEILHFDIKPANVYIPNSAPPILLDFGSARQSMVNKTLNYSHIFLTPGFAPIEQYTTNADKGNFTDIYACAATMYSALQGKFKSNGSIESPVSAIDRQEGHTLQHIKNVVRKQQPISDDLANAIMKGLEFHSRDRPQNVAEFKKLFVTQKPSPPPQNMNYEILVLAGDYEGEKIPLSSKPIIIGRSSKKSVLILTNNTISSTHCKIHSVNGVVYLQDMNSSNGTWLNDEKKLRPSETVKLKSGDTFSLAGCAVFQVIEAVQQPESIEENITTDDEVIDTPSPVNQPFRIYAGFWKRFSAALIDGIVTTIGCAIIGFIFGFIFILSTGINDPDVLEFIGNILGIFLVWLYFSVMESSSSQGTFGKMAVGIKVTDLSGYRVSFGKATGRHFGKIISTIIFLIGFIMVAFTDKKQGLHDMMSGCLIVNK